MTTIGGEVFTLTGDLSISSYSTSPSTTTYSVAPLHIDASGTSGSPVVMSATTGLTANTAITQGDFVYTVTVAVNHFVDGQEYKVTLLQDGTPLTPQSNVYIKQGSSDDTGTTIVISWDLGITLLSHVFEVDIVTVS
jgi:hypothetical protein